MSLLSRLLRKNTSVARIAGFFASSFMGLVIICGAVQFYADARGLFESDDSFIRSDMMVINKKVTSGSALGKNPTGFTDEEIASLERCPWVRRVGRFETADYRVTASVGAGGRSMSTMLFFESIPDVFVDAGGSSWHYEPGRDVPVIISKDYLSLYNFGFAGSAGMPQLSEQLMSGLPLRLDLSSDDGLRRLEATGRVVGYSSRLNTILVPKSFIDYSNARLGGGDKRRPQRLIIDVSSPGDVAIARYLEERGWESAGDKSASQASYLLKVVTGAVAGIGLVITVLSLFVILLGISLVMEKNKTVIHTLMQLGYEPSAIWRHYTALASASVGAACVAAVAAVALMRGYWEGPLSALGAGEGGIWPSVVSGVCTVLPLMLFNALAVRKKVAGAWR